MDNKTITPREVLKTLAYIVYLVGYTLVIWNADYSNPAVAWGVPILLVGFAAGSLLRKEAEDE